MKSKKLGEMEDMKKCICMQFDEGNKNRKKIKQRMKTRTQAIESRKQTILYLKAHIRDIKGKKRREGKGSKKNVCGFILKFSQAKYRGQENQTNVCLYKMI